MNTIKLLLSGRRNLQYYVDAVNGAGAEADAKYLPDIDTSYDGLILCGGNDIDPSNYNEPVDGAVEIDRDRDQVEFALLKAYIDAGKPVMGICRGFQLINIFFGGSLYQDLPETFLHTNQTDFYITHPVTAIENSIVGKIYGTSFSVNSSHHQAVKKNILKHLNISLCRFSVCNGILKERVLDKKEMILLTEHNFLKNL